MRMTSLHAPTLRVTPADAETTSHRLMLKAGMVRQSATGTYTWLHVGLRALQMVAAVVREEMDAAGAQEVLLPILQPASLWLTSGRWSDYGEELFRVRDRGGRDFALGPTHEEIITDLVAGEVRSYRQLPLCLYQVNTKFRDEVRPRHGVMRAREFLMKDAYSFDVDEAALSVTYARMYRAYRRIFRRLGLDARAALAQSGAIGGTGTHEFIVESDTGEATILACAQCDYLANLEQAEAVCPDEPRARSANPVAGGGEAALRLVDTPGAHTVAAVTEMLGVAARDLIKTMLVTTPTGKHAAALIRGDHELSLAKLASALGEASVELADAASVSRLTGAPVGFAGPVGLHDVTIIADRSIHHMPSAVTGANKPDAHFAGVRPGVDFRWDAEADIRAVAEGEPCPICGNPLRASRGIEVGHIFQLGTKYSERFGATYSDESGRLQPMSMGCYGVGISRTVAAIIERHHDERGIMWPLLAAPYTVAVLPLDNRDAVQMAAAERIYGQLRAAGIAAVIDDRPDRAGVKFNDADLLGWPLRVTIGSRLSRSAQLELTERASGATRVLPADDVTSVILDLLQAARDEARAELDAELPLA